MAKFLIPSTKTAAILVMTLMLSMGPAQARMPETTPGTDEAAERAFVEAFDRGDFSLDNLTRAKAYETLPTFDCVDGEARTPDGVCRERNVGGR